MEIRRIRSEDTWFIRHRVMWPDQDMEYVKLPNDDQGYHYGLFEEGMLISVVSLFVENGSAQFRKFATLIEKQGRGYGSRLLDFVIAEAIQMGVDEIWCNARENKVSFYERFGLEATDRRFEKGGVKYVIMQKKL